MRHVNSVFCPILFYALFIGCAEHKIDHVLDRKHLAEKHFQEDHAWFEENIPFFECSNKGMENVYYYRWKLYKAHLRNVGKDQFVITEFINHVAWDRDPYCTINAASMHHIYEGRWLRDPRYMDGYIRYLYRNGGNDRRYSESVADASFARYLVDGDQKFLTDHLDSMVSVYNRWSDHWDDSKKLYYIPAMPDATEYTIASIDASGGKDGFEGGEAFRPTINSYMFGNARAISRVAGLKGEVELSKAFKEKAASLQRRVEDDLWNDSLQHFCDRYQVDNDFVNYWDFIRGRELAGMIPWYFHLPSDKSPFHKAWHHVLDTAYLVGKYGFRTNEPSYEHYFKQFVFFEGKRGSQWNGPSWPYQSSQVLTGMQNVLHDYHQDVVQNSDYIRLLNLYTQQHFLSDGKINLVENYDPNNGGPIVHYYWSNHYNHSSYNNLIITGLCGLIPSETDTLTIQPLIDDSITYFCLDNISYRGHDLTVVYDKDGTRYKAGKGLTAFVDGKKVISNDRATALKVLVGPRVLRNPVPAVENVALNIRRTGYPMASASVNNNPDSIYQAVDGRIWYFPEITNCWNTVGSKAKSDWYAITFAGPKKLSQIKIYPLVIPNKYVLANTPVIEIALGGKWKEVSLKDRKKLQPNTSNVLQFEEAEAEAIRLTFDHGEETIAIGEVELY